MTRARLDRPAALRARADALLQAGRISEAQSALEALLADSPADVALLLRLGAIAMATRRYEHAARYFGLAQSADPDSPVAAMNLGLALAEMGENVGALAAFDRTLQLNPGLAEAHCNRGVPLERLGNRDEALRSYDRAIALEPNHVRAWNNKGSVLLALGRPEMSVDAYDRAIAIDPASSSSHSKRGVALYELGRRLEAKEAFARAISLDRSNAEAYFNAALCHLAAGEYAEGWRLYEWRKRLARPVGSPQRMVPTWTGAQPLEGRSVYVHAEQGLGDTLQFCRYALALAQRGARVVLAVQRPLVRLVSTIGGEIQVIDRDEPVPTTDYQSSLLSLPHALGAPYRPISAEIPYLHAEADRIAAWRERLRPGALRVGIAWSGNATYLDLGRFFAPALFGPLAQASDVQLISLQKSAPTDELAYVRDTLGAQILGDEFDAGPHAFIDSAAILESLDVLITPDTALVHVAGALGRPAWLLLRHSADWRWGLTGSDTIWYPSVKLFRQPRAGDWNSPIAAVCAALGELRARG